MDGDSVKHVYEGFWISILLKGLISLGEMLAGIVVVIIPTAFLTGSALWLVHSGLIGSETGFVARQVLSTVTSFTSNTQKFVALYLFSRGLIKVCLIGALIKNKLWAYPASLVVLGLFVIYQVYQIISSHSVIIAAITVFDLIVMYFIWCEYKVVKVHHGARQEVFAEGSTGTE